MCPAPTVTVSPCDKNSKEASMRMWSNASQWPGGTMPKPGDNITIPCNWTVFLDINPEPMGMFILDGSLIINDTFDVNLTANFIHIRSGDMLVGTNGSPFTHNLTIQINGQPTDTPYVLDSFITGSKLFIVSGALALHGVKPDTLTTYLS
jgi:hypothetical protein